jgi:hypothetical protein
MALLLHIPTSTCSTWNWDDIFLLFPRIPNGEPTFWTTEVLFVVSTKTPHVLCTSISQETPFTYDEATSLSEQYLPLPEVISLCGQNYIKVRSLAGCSAK